MADCVGLQLSDSLGHVEMLPNGDVRAVRDISLEGKAHKCQQSKIVSKVSLGRVVSNSGEGAS